MVVVNWQRQSVGVDRSAPIDVMPLNAVHLHQDGKELELVVGPRPGTYPAGITQLREQSGTRNSTFHHLKGAEQRQQHKSCRLMASRCTTSRNSRCHHLSWDFAHQAYRQVRRRSHIAKLFPGHHFTAAGPPKTPLVRRCLPSRD
ncbi:hypothetical protein VFPPC_17890 [Pochonia chlamydosporia 170]|uniref:Uncharacterized protein n=1 Tax=Pochonia chlamydosporia 170 TaxID=1380566 RepID=A0A219AQ39_METCM|nr:hypothetical protein VFPPC_17890 [Pochonia chlamydosporia 170]OWT42917.1 hypothetical protein VFPPC_17890 [Pochonia chlamydosporia 170]